MTIGLVTQTKEYSRRNFLKRLSRKKLKKMEKSDKNPFDLIVEVIPFSEETLEEMSSYRLEKLITKYCNRLKNCNVDQIIYSDFLEKILAKKTFLPYQQTGQNLFFLKKSPDCIRYTAEKCGIDLLKSIICIREFNAGRISEYLMRELCFDTKRIVLCTKNKKTAKDICDRFYEETGLLVNVFDYDEKSADICIDADANELKFGADLYVRDANLGFDFGEYQVSNVRAAGLLTEFKPQKIAWIYSHKKIS
ncbi:MAG: hypothetical protein IJE62_05380 [Clostridia bacterium]|nr:hypothetical protein [Clostridia bacterium]